MEQEMNLNLQGLGGVYASRRELVYARHGMVCTSQPLAAQVGLDALKQGGNAIDAAVAAAATMTVVEPTSNGLGSDCFALVWIEKDRKLYGMNASGVSPMGLSYETVEAAGGMQMRGWMPVMVSGAPAGWQALTERFGRRTLSQNVEGAAWYAETGYPVEPTCAKDWAASFVHFDRLMREQAPSWLSPWFETFAPEGRAPRAGEVWRCPDMAGTIREIGESEAESFYRGNLSRRMDAFSKATGGFLRYEDLAAYRPDFVEPLRVDYRGYTVWELPPNGDGMIALMTLNMLSTFEPGQGTADIHRRIEALKLAFADGQAHLGDPVSMRLTSAELLSPAYARQRSALIGENALLPVAGNPRGSGTIYLCTADGDGNMVSLIQSNYMGFGSGVVIPGTGISLQNRGCGFSMNPQLPNCYGPGKKAFHTIIPGFLTREGRAVGPFGVMGGFMQPQGHVQVVTGLLDLHLNPQDALDAPRWQWTGEKRILLEKDFPEDVREDLKRRGHEVTVTEDSGSFGRGHCILRMDNGTLVGAAEKRAAGTVCAY